MQYSINNQISEITFKFVIYYTTYGSLVGSVLAKKEKQDDGSDMVPTVPSSSGKDSSSPSAAVLREDSTKLNGANADDSSGNTGDASSSRSVNVVLQKTVISHKLK